MAYKSQTTTILIALSLGLSGAALAGEPEMTLNELGQRTITVQFDDLNMNDPKGVATLERRLETASRRVCGKTRSARNRNIALTQKRAICYDRVIAEVLDNKAFASIDKDAKNHIALNIAAK